jgi:hypothetical protein
LLVYVSAATTLPFNASIVSGTKSNAAVTTSASNTKRAGSNRRARRNQKRRSEMRCPPRRSFNSSDVMR